MRVLIKLPSRERPQKLVAVLRKYTQFAKEPQALHFLVSLDEDDPSVNESLLQTLRTIHPHMDIHVGRSENKIHAINRDMDKAPPFDILLLASDDMIPMVQGYDQEIRSKMQKHYPDTDGVLWFNDGYCGTKLNTLVICGKKYYDRFGFIYNPLYKSFYCDNEFMDVANELGKQTYFPNVIIKHIHPANTSEVKMDPLYERNNGPFRQDEKTYWSRKNYPFDLSILICTLPIRKAMFDALLAEFQAQARRASIRVEILSDNHLTDSVGVKRSRLVKRAQGKYCCFVDDDDRVSSNYIFLLIPGIQGNYDCIALNGMMYTDGLNPKPFYHSIKYGGGWSEDVNGYYRYPNHLNCMLSYIMKFIGFENKSYGEDYDFSQRLYQSKLLQREYDQHTDTQYVYYYVRDKSVTADTRRRGLGKDTTYVRENLSQAIQSQNNKIQNFRKSSGLKFAI